MAGVLSGWYAAGVTTSRPATPPSGPPPPPAPALSPTALEHAQNAVARLLFPEWGGR